MTLLDRALALLPEDTREVLVRRYIEESPLAEIAARLETNASAVAMRLQRGKLALRKVLTSQLQAEIAEYTRAAGERRWERTSLWCHGCGQHRLLGYKEPERGLLYLKCPACSPGDEVISKNEEVPFLRGMKSYKPAFARLSQWCNMYYRQGLREGSMRCDTCGHAMTVKISPREEVRQLLWLSTDKPTWAMLRNERVLSITCPHCDNVSCISLEGLVLSLPEGQAFLQAHPRVHLLPDRSIEFSGRPAIVTHFASVLDAASFEVISDYETFEVLKIVGGGK